MTNFILKNSGLSPCSLKGRDQKECIFDVNQPLLKRLFILFFFIGLGVISLRGQSEKIIQLEEMVSKYNDEQKYEKSIEVLTDFIDDPQTSSHERFYAYLYKSYTYKRLFNYPKTLYYIDEAYKEGMKSEHKEEVNNNVMAEKSFVYFDTREYDKAEQFIKKLRTAGYKHLPVTTKAWIIMQEGYINMLNKNYLDAEKNLDEAAVILEDGEPHNLPNIYAKKLELYNRMFLPEKRDSLFHIALANAKKYKKIKYEMYLYEVMKDIYKQNHDHKNALAALNAYDSLELAYIAINKSSELEILEKKSSDAKQDRQLKNEKYFKYILLGCLVIIIMLLGFFIKLSKANKEKRLLAEKETVRIKGEITHLTKQLDEKSKAAVDLSKFNLNERQLEIVKYIKEGKSNKEMADLMFISENTVKYHLKNIYEILQIENRMMIK
ncbi:MAG: hypothetical protein IPI53_10765 [Saprospiraceae bacterium]|nr:hypothetical protein [Saprospiraceae bacterium]